MKDKFTEAGAKRADRIIEGNISLAEFMGFKRYFPNMSNTSELSKHYHYPYMDDVFDESMYVSDIHTVCVEGKFKCINITQSRHISEYKFHNSMAWLFPIVQKIFSLPQEEISPLDLADVNLAWNRKDITEIWESCVRFVIKYQNDK